MTCRADDGARLRQAERDPGALRDHGRQPAAAGRRRRRRPRRRSARFLGEGDYELGQLERQGGTRSQIGGPLWDAVQSFVDAEEPGAVAAPICVAGFTDSHWLRQAFGTVAYGFFPARAMDPETAARLIHSADERVPVDDLELGVRWLRHAAQSVCGYAMLELLRAGGRVRALAEYVAASGLSTSTSYLGYGLSDPLRRDDTPGAAGAVPAAAAGSRIRRSACVDSTQSGFSAGEWVRDLGAADYAAAIDAVRAAIARGDVYQVNLVQHLSAPFARRPARARCRARAAASAARPRARRATAGRSSPRRRSSSSRGAATLLVTRPIKGTRPLGEDVDDEKDAAEHVMIVDLERNDLSRVCEPGTVRWPELMRQRELAGVTHLDSTVEGRLRRGRASPRSCTRRSPAARSPARRRSPRSTTSRGSSRSGAARRWARSGRSAPNGDFELALTIRTFAVADGARPSLGRRRDRLGLRPRAGGRGVVGQGAAAARAVGGLVRAA